MSAALLDDKIWGDPDYRPDMTFLNRRDARVDGLAMGVVRDHGGEPTGFVKLLAVIPDRRGNGTGSRLLAALESAMAIAGARVFRVAESAPNYLAPGVDTRYADGLRFLRNHGYEPGGETCNMKVDLRSREFPTDRVEQQLVQKGIRVRRASRRDSRALEALVGEFGGTWWHEVQRSMACDPPAVHVADRAERLLAFAACGGNNADAGWFGPMGTTPDARGLGIGAVLLRRCLRELQGRGFREATIPWVGPVVFYEKHAGAKVAGRYLRLEKRLPG